MNVCVSSLLFDYLHEHGYFLMWDQCAFLYVYCDHEKRCTKETRCIALAWNCISSKSLTFIGQTKSFLKMTTDLAKHTRFGSFVWHRFYSISVKYTTYWSNKLQRSSRYYVSFVRHSGFTSVSFFVNHDNYSNCSIREN